MIRQDSPKREVRVKSSTAKSSKPQAGKVTISTAKKKINKDKYTTMSGDVIHDSLEGPEIIIGLVEAVGTNSNEVITQITNCFRPYNYSVEVVSISRDVMPSILNIGSPAKLKEYRRIKKMMDSGDRIRELFKDNGILSYGATSLINLKRKNIEEQEYTPDSWPGYAKRTAYIIKTLKRPEEVELLRKVYGPGFYLIGIYTEEHSRIESLKDKGVNEREAKELSLRDADGHTDYGQKASETYRLADFFLQFEDSIADLKAHTERIIKLLFGHPHLTPLFDEFAMFMAFAASLRSADLSRQVGAVITKDDEILATGANDCPRKGGGLYWTRYDKKKKVFITEHPKGTDADRGYDSNSREKNDIVDEIIADLSRMRLKKEEVRKSLENSRLMDITEYGRSVHAEMEAIMHCARNNTNTKGATLYCTTFPCHNCAKHIVSAGIERVVYVEPYPKSKALKLHCDSISNTPDDSSEKVIFEPFMGVGSRRFFDLFSMCLGLGTQLERKTKKGDKIEWEKKHAEPRIRLSPLASTVQERAANEYYYSKIEQIGSILGIELKKAKVSDILNLLKRNKK
jgi:cytidine deaminase